MNTLQVLVEPSIVVAVEDGNVNSRNDQNHLRNVGIAPYFAGYEYFVGGNHAAQP